MWIFFILAFQVSFLIGYIPLKLLKKNLPNLHLYGFQAMLIIAWSPTGSLLALFEEDVLQTVLSIFVTAAILKFLQGTG